MIDLSDTIIPKTDQLNADCLVAGPRTIVITDVKNVGGEQPIIISYEGQEGRPYKPCMGMRRLLVHVWGKDGSKYIGRSLTLFNNPEVKWAGQDVGGIQISHASDIESDVKFMMTISRGKKSPYTLKPLITKPKNALTDDVLKSLTDDMDAATTMKDIQAIGKKIKAADYDDAGRDKIRPVFDAAKERVRGLL